MKPTFISACFALTLLVACNKKETAEPADTPAAPESAVTATAKSCYEFVKGKDTVSLSLAMNANNANGLLAYHWSEKDRNDGTLSRTFIGDTLYADYTFKSEGKSSIREVAFLRHGETLTEGHGDMEEKNGKMCFKNPRKVQFDNNSLVLLSAKDCK